MPKCLFLSYEVFENHPSLEGNNNFVKSQIFGRVVKLEKCHLQFKTHFISSTACQNFHQSYQVNLVVQLQVLVYVLKTTATG